MSFSKRLLSGDAPALVPGENFNVVTYTGNGGSQSITGVGFKPDWVWCKRRNEAADHNLSDSSRGVMTGLNINSNAQEGDQDPLGVTVFGDDGFTVSDNDGGGAGVNGTNDTYVAWCWKAAGGTTSSNTDGSTTSTVQANKAAGFSIVTYTGTGANATIGHGLSVAPELVIVKKRSGAQNWMVGTDAIGWTKYLEINLTNAQATASTTWNNTAPSATTVSLGTSNNGNTSAATYIMYAFHSVEGFSKIGSYTGISSGDIIVETGFEPRFIMIKCTSHASTNWEILDSRRSPGMLSNGSAVRLRANDSSSEAGGGFNNTPISFLSNGFRINSSVTANSYVDYDANGRTYLYMAFAADPDTEAPTLASSFNIETYTGTGSSNSITGLGFQPNFLWIKSRTNTLFHNIFNSSIGASYVQYSNSTSAGETNANILSSFDTDGFTVGTDNSANQSGQDFVAWAWKADDNEPTINTNGSITSFVNANVNAGFSIVKYTGTGSAGTIGHGLSAKCDLVLIKTLDSTNNWIAQTPQLGDNARMLLDTTAAKSDDATTAQAGNATVFGIGADNSVAKSGDSFIAYCFHSVSGYSKFGSYSGSGSDGNSITTGFKPDFVMVKRTNDSGGWLIFDTKRSNGNPVDDRLEANNTQAEQTNSNNKYITVSATGFSANNSDTELNASGSTYIYWAIAKNVLSNTTLANSFKAVTYTGTGSSQSITGTGFQPDLVWIKGRTNTASHQIFDTVRGATLQISSDTTSTETQNTSMLTGFDSDGFTLGGQSSVNGSGVNYIGWAWKAGNTWQSNIDGTIGSIVNANTANGFSIVKYTGTGSATTVGHGLSGAPEMIIVKNLSNSHSGNAHWAVYHTGVGHTKVIYLNRTNAEVASSAFWNDTAPTSSVFSIGTDNDVNVDGEEFIAYCFDSVSGYSKIGSYTGNGSTQSITGLGFQPDWIMIKNADSARGWQMFDSVRGANQLLFANSDSAESSESAGTSLSSFDSDGFTVGSGNGVNESGDTLIYKAFRHVLDPQPGFMSFLVVGGGGSGAVYHGGGGGAGGLRTSFGDNSGGGTSAENDITLSAVTYTITVGAGGAGVTYSSANVAGNNGGNSSIAATGLTTITSTGGGGGSSYSGQTNPGDGGSGGGGGNQSQAGGAGTTGQGFAGGSGSSSSSNYPSGGGGGASAAGGNGSGSSAGNGGAGLSVSITGSPVVYAGGAGGSSFRGGTAGTGGTGGGANGTNSDGNGNAGTANTGGGGSGATAGTSGAGGTGVVILRLFTSEYSGSTTGSPTVTTHGDYTILKYTSSGTYVHS